MSNTVITNYTDLNGPSTKTDSSVVVIVNKDGSLSVDQKLLDTLMGTDGSQAAGISVVRVGHEGRPDDATDSEDDNDKVPHVTLSVDSYYDEPDSIIKYDSGAEMLQSLRIETRENSLVGFQNDHCYTPLTSPSQTLPQKSETFASYDDSVIEITHAPPPKPDSLTPKKVEQRAVPKSKKVLINPMESSIVLKGNDIANKVVPVLSKSKLTANIEKNSDPEDQSESSSVTSSGESAPDRDSDSDYKESTNKLSPHKLRKAKTKPRILKSISKTARADPKTALRLKASKKIQKEIKGKASVKNVLAQKNPQASLVTAKTVLPATTITKPNDVVKITPKAITKAIKKEKKTPAHVTALLTDMTALFSTPDVIRRVSTETKVPNKLEKDIVQPSNKQSGIQKTLDISNEKILLEANEKSDIFKTQPLAKTYAKQAKLVNLPSQPKPYDTIPQLDDASLAQILQDSSPHTSKANATISNTNVINSPSLAGPLSPTLDLLAGLQPEEDGLTEDLLMHVAQLVESSENLQEVLDKQVMGKVAVGTVVPPPTTSQSPAQSLSTMHETTPSLSTPSQDQITNLYTQTPVKTPKNLLPRKDPIEIVRRDGRVITLPPIEAPATRSSKRKSQVETVTPIAEPVLQPPVIYEQPEPPVPIVSKQCINKKIVHKKNEQMSPTTMIEKSAESQESWNSEDDPYRLWCICRQPHNNRFMICCDGCEDWFHGKCVNITKAMGQQMEEQGIEWRCPNCVKNSKQSSKSANKANILQKTVETQQQIPASKELGPKSCCIVCKKPARASSIYCSDSCILKHAQDSLSVPTPTAKTDSSVSKTVDKGSESRVIVYERKSGRLLAGPNAPTAENLKSWLQKNPTFEVVRPGTLSTIKPNIVKKKLSESNKIQTTLNFAKIPRKSAEQMSPVTKSSQQESKEKSAAKTAVSPKEHIKLVLKKDQIKMVSPKEQSKSPIVKESPKLTPKEEPKPTPQPKTPVTPKSQPSLTETPKSLNRTASEQRKSRALNRSLSSAEKRTPPANIASPSISRRKDSSDKKKMDSEEEIRENVRKALQEQINQRMCESDGFQFSEDEIQQYAYETEFELFELFNHDVGMKYKAKYRSLMFNIKDRKNLSLWEKICERTLKPKELVRLSPEELASQELAQWREEESKYQLELIKKSEIDLLAASKTYVLKTHKGEEVMETKESVSTELDPNVAVEDIVTILNDAVGDGALPTETAKPSKTKETKKKSSNSRKKDKDKSKSGHSKRDRENKRDSEKRQSRSTRRSKVQETKEHKSSRRGRSQKKSRSSRSESKEKSREKSDTERSRNRSRSRARSKRRSRERTPSRARVREDARSTRGSRRSESRETSRRRRRSRSKRRSSADDVTHRSRSQEAVGKNKNDSTDSDSVERPKSAMMKEIHPEYDPHEPMITSAFSEEDLRKSGEEINEISEYGNIDVDSSKSFTLHSDIPLPDPVYFEKQEKNSAETESDQEPTSTVENSAVTVWNGCINMVDVARFYVAAHEASGNAIDLEEDLMAELDIVGRINPDTVWDYIGKMKRTGNKDIVVLRLQAANDEERMQYIALYSYLSSRNRLGVVKVTNTATVKDFYIVPLSANTSLPKVMLPLEGPGLGEVKTHLLIAIIIRQRKKRLATHIPKDIIPAKVARESRKKSYTPPLSPRNRQLPTYTSPALSSTVKDKIAASLAAADDDEPYSPGSSNSSSGATAALPSSTLKNKMEELNRQIEEQKQQIMKMAQSENEAYSPSKPLSPSQAQSPVNTLADISLPSNLQEILATIKQRSENTTADVDMRTIPMT